jgi:hypothetical protein
MSSMLSAPAVIPATRQPAFRSAFTPVRLAILTFWGQGRQAAPLGQGFDKLRSVM